MLDPTWTPEAGYSHADALLTIIKRQEAKEAEERGNDNPEERS
jgi:hypothetical protein